jgi:hypothetical protein
LRFCLSDLVKIKAVPARTRTANLLKLLQSCLLASIHRLGIRSSLSSRSAKSVASNALISDWQFTTKNARIKLKHLYPAI